MGWVTVGEGDEARHIFLGSGGKVLATRSAISKASGGTERGKATIARSKAAIMKGGGRKNEGGKKPVAPPRVELLRTKFDQEKRQVAQTRGDGKTETGGYIAQDGKGNYRAYNARGESLGSHPTDWKALQAQVKRDRDLNVSGPKREVIREQVEAHRADRGKTAEQRDRLARKLVKARAASLQPANRAHESGPGGPAKATGRGTPERAATAAKIVAQRNAAKLKPNSSAAAPKPAPSLREQAAAARAGKGLSPEERATAAATKYSFWRSGAPTSGLGAARSSRQEASSKVIEAGAAKNPAAYAKARAEVEAKIAAFQAKRGTPELKLSPSGAKLKVKEYDNWQQFKGTKEVSSAPERERYAATSSGYGKKEQIGVLLARKSWDEHDLKQAEGHVKSGDAPAELKQQVKDYKATGARTALEPSKSDVLRQRKLQGITGRIKPVITKR